MTHCANCLTTTGPFAAADKLPYTMATTARLCALSRKQAALVKDPGLVDPKTKLTRLDQARADVIRACLVRRDKLTVVDRSAQ